MNRAIELIANVQRTRWLGAARVSLIVLDSDLVISR